MADQKNKQTKGKFWQDKKKRNAILIILFVLLNVAVIAITARAEFGNSKTAAELSEVKIDWWLLIPAAICFIIAINFEIHKYALLMCEISKKDTELDKKHIRKVARRTVLLGKYYDNITPGAIGGQPFQIYYMRKNSGLPTGVSTSIPIFCMIAGQMGFLIIAFVCFIFGASAINNAVLLTTAWFGLLFYAFWPVMVAGASFFPKQTTGIIKFFVKLLHKLKIIKNREEALEKTEAEIGEYVKSIKVIMKTKGLFLKTILLSLGFNLLIALIPFFVLTAFGGEMDFWVCLSTTVAVTAAVYFIPTPGNAGAAEGTFFLVFSGLSTGYVFWAMLVWRFFSYKAKWRMRLLLKPKSKR